MFNVDVGSSGWIGCQPQQWHNDIILTQQVSQNPNIWPKIDFFPAQYYLPSKNNASKWKNS